MTARRWCWLYFSLPSMSKGPDPLFFAYGRVGFKKATSPISLAHVKEVSPRTLLEQQLAYLLEPQVLRNGALKAWSEALFSLKVIRVPLGAIWGPTGLISLFPAILCLEDAGRTLNSSCCVLFHVYLLEWLDLNCGWQNCWHLSFTCTTFTRPWSLFLIKFIPL